VIINGGGRGPENFLGRALPPFRTTAKDAERAHLPPALPRRRLETMEIGGTSKLSHFSKPANTNRGPT
jgi:hypothetical protein